MKARLLRLSNTLRESYWFVPTIMALAALLLALTTVMIDSHAGSTTWTTGLPGLDTARPDGARSLLSAIGGSMIGVAGTTFSVTIAAVVYASGQYGPRLLSNFMSDRGNQVTLGTFIATFVYSLVVLRTIHSAGEGGSAVAAFVPQLALLIALVLVLCSIAVLIYFIHHVPMQIHINSVIEQIGGRLVDDIEARFPARDEPPSATSASAMPVPAALLAERPVAGQDGPAAIACHGMGYIQLIDEDAVIAVAQEHDMVVRLHRQPGDFVHKHSVLMTAWPADACTEQAATVLRHAVALGSRRSALQDLRFLIDELVEIAARALSPGVNDPFTASSCLDWLGAALATLARRRLPPGQRVDAEGSLRLVAQPVTFEGFVDRAFGALAQYASADMIAGKHYLDALGDVARNCDDPALIATLARQARAFRALAAKALDGACRDAVVARADSVLNALVHAGAQDSRAGDADRMEGII
ncbi:DUF2254 domain-containing protein [Novosphingobium sp. AAP1]|uniref:DUF2254 domain-containing protein n=1 Tax=Novosphingobium sp. AAP1 TaxID=1523413 RepID=UPI0006B8BDBD|nr:DUF2254 domain-containing protein [Novosphingobium sp. AAP1]